MGQGQPPITLENTAVVDKTVIFMNNVGATQELARRTEQLWEQVPYKVANSNRVARKIFRETAARHLLVIFPRNFDIPGVCGKQLEHDFFSHL